MYLYGYNHMDKKHDTIENNFGSRWHLNCIHSPGTMRARFQGIAFAYQLPPHYATVSELNTANMLENWSLKSL